MTSPYALRVAKPGQAHPLISFHFHSPCGRSLSFPVVILLPTPTSLSLHVSHLPSQQTPPTPLLKQTPLGLECPPVVLPFGYLLENYGVPDFML